MRRRTRLLLLTAAAAVIAAVAATAAVLALGGGDHAAIPASVRSRLGLFSLQGKRAPDFTLVDQRGRTVSLSSLRGRVVVLEFFDSTCTDICPIVSQEYVDANRLLGAQAKRAAFVAVNVNQYHEKVADVAAFSHAHRLDTIPSWHFLTGTTPTLKAVWKAYGVSVQPTESGDVVHSSPVYFIDAGGRMRWLSFAKRVKDAGVLVWGRGIAAVVRGLL